MKSNEPQKWRTEPKLISTAVADWLDHCRRYTSETQRHYKMVIMHFVESLPEEVKTIDQLHSNYIENFISELLKRCKNRTANSQLTGLKSSHRWLAKQYDMPNHAAKVGLLREDPPVRRVLTEEEYKQVLNACSELRDTIEFIGNTGLRSCEIVNLKWGNITTDSRYIIFTGKGRKQRVVPLNTICKNILARYKRGPDDSLVDFVRRYNKRDALYYGLRSLAMRVGITPFGPHAIRHYFAAALLRHGVPIAHVSKLMGHASIKTTESVYIHFEPEHLNGLTEILTKDAPGNQQRQMGDE